MRRLMFLLVAVSFLGTMVGCNTCGSRGCGLSSCGTSSGCSTGRCSSGGHGHSHGICDCEHDDYCTSRSPWIRHSHSSVVTPITTTPVTEVVPVAPSKLPDGKMKL